MTENLCAGCERPTPDGAACVACAVDRPRKLLDEIQDMLPAALDVAHRQARHGTSAGGHGKPGSALPLDLGATARLDGVQTALTTWARHISEIRGVEIPDPPTVEPVRGPTCARPYACGHESCRTVREPLRVIGDAEHAAEWLAAHCEWMRHRPQCAEFLGDVEACARIVRGIARGPADRVYLGPCGAVVLTPEPWRSDVPAGTECDTDLWGRLGARQAVCRTCGARHDVDERITERTALAHSYRYSAAEIEQAYGGVILASTIRQWKRRGLLGVHGEIDGQPLYEVAEVLKLVETSRERHERNAGRPRADAHV